MEDRTIYSKNGKHAILLFHAYTSTPNDVLALSRELERQDYSVYAPTFSGHGTDDPDVLLNYGIKDWVKDGEEAYEFLENEGFEAISIFGLSLGGLVATDLVLKKEPNIAGTFSSPVMASEQHNIPENFVKWYRMKKYKLGHSTEEIDKMVETAYPKVEGVVEDLGKYTQSMIPEYKNITGNIFIGQAGADEMIDQSQAEEFKDALVNANVELKYYEEAPHAITTGKTGKLLREDLVSFLNNIK